MRSAPSIPGSQRGLALLSALLLLMIITLMAIAMFRGVGTQEKIAGNLREKDRALHSATSAQQYGEWWLLQGTNVAAGAVTCGAGVLNANLGVAVGQICSTAQPAQVMSGGDMTIPANWAVRTEYLPTGMSVTAGTPGTNGDIAYAKVPAFYISDLGLAGDGAGEAYQVAAYGYGGSLTSVAVVESVYEVQQGVVNRGGL
jgi:type IV pilus assembly protein PilX